MEKLCLYDAMSLYNRIERCTKGNQVYFLNGFLLMGLLGFNGCLRLLMFNGLFGLSGLFGLLMFLGLLGLRGLFGLFGLYGLRGCIGFRTLGLLGCQGGGTCGVSGFFGEKVRKFCDDMALLPDNFLIRSRLCWNSSGQRKTHPLP